MADYGTFVDQGRKPGKQPPISKIRQWLSIKGIPQKAAFPIAKKIGRYGIKPTPFFSITIQKHVKELEDKIAKLAIEGIEKEIKI